MLQGGYKFHFGVRLENFLVTKSAQSDENALPTSTSKENAT